MSFINYSNKEINLKIVYYGAALSGKTTCLKYIYDNARYKDKGRLVTLDTDGDRTLFFDFLPIELGKLGDYNIKIQLYTVPGQVAYDKTRKLVLHGADGVVFVADSQVKMREQNIESYNNLKKNLISNGLPEEIPLVFQYNKRDLKEILPVDILNQELNKESNPFFPTIATTGENVLEALNSIIKNTILDVKSKLSIFKGIKNKTEEKKDKTIVFSRDEITSRADENTVREDTEKEEVVELAEPLSEETMEEDEDIFDLSDNVAVDESNNDIFHEEEDEVIVLEDNKKTSKVELDNISFDINDDNIDFRTMNAYVENLDLPLTIEIPKDKKDIVLNIKLQIKIKKK